MERAFIEIKEAVAARTLLRFPDWSKPFTLHTNASYYQLGGVLSQEGSPIAAFFSRRLNSAQKNYTTTEKELLSIVECLKEFRNFGTLPDIFLFERISFESSLSGTSNCGAHPTRKHTY
jgi:hypothetical protein